MTAALAGMPGPAFGPGQPLPGGRPGGEGDGEREARRLASRLAVAQRRLGLPSPTTAAGPAIIEDLPETPAATDPMTMRSVSRLGRLGRLRGGRR